MNADWTSSNIARYTPEAAVFRFRRVMPDTLCAKSLFVGQAYLYAGFANRLLGENFCQSVIPVEMPDPTHARLGPGSLGPQTLYFRRADTAFTNAIAVFIASGLTDTGTTSLLRAAYAGRASVRADLATYGLAQWADVLTDAVLVTNTAVFKCRTQRPPPTSTTTSTGRGPISRSGRTPSGAPSTRITIGPREIPACGGIRPHCKATRPWRSSAGACRSGRKRSTRPRPRPSGYPAAGRCAFSKPRRRSSPVI